MAPNGRVVSERNRVARGFRRGFISGLRLGALNSSLNEGLNAAANGAGSGSPYSSPDGQGSYVSFLMSGAEVISTQGALMISQQQAALAQEKARAERIVNDHRYQEEQLYTRARSPTSEDDRERIRVQARDRSRNNPSSTEIWSGKALNNLLVDLQRLRANGAGDAGDAPLYEETLSHINVTPAREENNAGLLRHEGRLDWPAALNRLEFEQQRQEVSALARQAVSQTKALGRVESDMLDRLESSVAQLHKDLAARVNEFTPTQYVAAKGFLNEFDSAPKALQQPDAGNYFNGKYSIRGKTISEIVKHMTAEGLRFAPASPGDESAYMALHQALAAYDFAAQAEGASARR
jgi:hypothetical protein